jgi:hypothetical protein
MKKISMILFLAVALAVTAVAGPSYALTANTTYTITISKLNSNGTLTEIETVPATTDTSGKLTFSLSTMPTNADANFIVFTIKDANGALALQGVVPAPPAGDANQIGINDLATKQAATFIKAAELAGTDDPILAAYLLVILRSPNVTPDDVLKLGTLGKAAITGNAGFEGYLAANVSAVKLTALKKCLIYNPDSTKKTLRDFTKGFFTAVESGDAATEKSETQKAGGLMADVFMDAAACADIQLGYITNAHEAAGNAADATGLMQGGADPISPNVVSSIDQSMTAFNKKIGMVKMVTEYTNALSTLKASGAQVDTFINAAKAMAVATSAIDTQYGDYFRDPAAYLAANQTDAATVKAAIDALYTAAWTSLQVAIASSNSEIDAMKAGIIATFPGIQLPSDFGQNYNGFQVTNWPVQQVVMVNWMVNVIKNGGSISYTRDTTAIPAMMQNWMGVCSDTQFWDKSSCLTNGGTWTAQRHTFTTPSAAFNAYLGLQEDVNIADMARNSIWSDANGNQLQPTQETRMQAETDFIALLGTIKGKFIATKDAAGTSVTDMEKEAVIKLMLQPQAN